MTFRVGQKVVCVKPCNDLIKGRVYSVTAMGTQKGISMLGVDQSYFGPRASFYADRFRPIVERKTDISVFTKMLIPEGVEA